MINFLYLCNCIPFGVNLILELLRAFYAIAQKAKGAIPQFEATGIIEIDHQKDVFQIPLQKAGCVYSRMSF